MPLNTPQNLSRWLPVGALLCYVAMVAAASAAPGPAATLSVSQAVVAGRDITVYLDVRDASDAFVPGLTPTQLQATLGAQTPPISAMRPFADTGEGVYTVFLVDISKSITEAQFARIRAALKDWVGAMAPSDRAALVSFGKAVTTLVEPTGNTAALNAAIAGLARSDMQTALHAALVRGLELGRSPAADLPTRRVIVTLTDGEDDAPGLMTAGEVTSAIAAAVPVPIYAIGFSTLTDRTRRAAGLNALGAFARATGGVFTDASGASDPATAYAAMRKRVREVYQIKMRCDTCVLDGNPQRLNLTLTAAGTALPVGVDVRMLPVRDASGRIIDPPPLPPTPTPTPVETTPVWVPWAIVGGATLLLLLFALWAWRRRKPAVAPVASPLIDDAEPDWHPNPDMNITPDWPSPPLMPTAPMPPMPPRPAPTPAGPRATLRLAITNGPRRGENLVLTLAPTAIIGRGGACEVSLPTDPEASQRHAELKALNGGKVVLRDLGSTNGTRLNGIPIQGSHPLTNGDLLGVGQTECRVTL